MFTPTKTLTKAALRIPRNTAEECLHRTKAKPRQDSGRTICATASARKLNQK